MRKSVLRFAFVAIAAIVALPARAIEAAVDLFRGFVEFVDVQAFRGLFSEPELALEVGSLEGLEPALLHRQRHEAGLSRLGAVRHV